MHQSVARVLILGANGLLGSATTVAARDALHAVHGVDLPAIDIRRLLHVSDVLADVLPDLVVNCAAMTDVDGCERDPDQAFAVNAVGAENVARAAEELGVPLVHISTDFVFDGTAGRRYDESDAPCPQSVYGRSKLEGEERVLRTCSRSFVVRSGYLYGRGGRNFGSTLVDRLRRGETIRADRSRRVAPTWVRPLAETILHIARTTNYGVWHAGCEGETTWFDFAQAVARTLDVRATIEEADTGSLQLLAPRPPCSLLDNRRLREAGLPPMPRWDAALSGFLADEGRTHQ